MLRRYLNAKNRNNIRKCDGSKKNAMSVSDFVYQKKRGEKRKSVRYHINDSLICKYVWSTKKRIGETIADRLAGGERKWEQK